MSELNLEKTWKAVKAELEMVVSKVYFNTHVTGAYIKSVDIEDRLVEITCASEYSRNFIEDRLYGHIKSIVSKILGPDFRLMFTVTKKEPTKISASDIGPLFTTNKPESVNFVDKLSEVGLNVQYNFDRYIIGNHNRLAYAVSTAIANDPGKVYNPFFLYSKVGLGKTHLIQAIGHETLKKHPKLKIMYKSGEQFLNEVVDAIRSGHGGGRRGSANELKKKYRNLDMLIIDDIHAIAGKESTQEEFFHTFNALYMAQKQIILTSDRAPNEIKTLEERLSSRFGSGMIADIQTPDEETRLAILKARNEELKLGASLDVLIYIAKVVNTNIRELEAKLIQAVTTAKAQQVELTPEGVSSVLGHLERQKAVRITPGTILKETSKYYGVTIKDLKGSRRTKNLVVPRQISMYLLRYTIDMGYQAIGETLGGRDHSTVIHGVTKVERDIKSNESFSKEVEQIKSNIKTAHI